MNKKEYIAFDVDHLKMRMNEAGATQKEIAKRIGVSDTVLCREMNRGEIQLSHLNAIYEELGKGGFHRDIHNRYPAEKTFVNGDDITEELKRQGYFLKEMAQAIGVNPSTLSSWLRHDSCPASLLPDMASFLGLEISDITAGAKEPEMEQLEIPFVEDEPVYTAQDFKEFVNLLADKMMDFLAEYIDQLEEV